MLLNALVKATPKPLLSRIEIAIVEHCNLNCNHCIAFSPIAKKGFYALDSLRRDLTRLSELSHQTLGSIRILGGEPLLHPQLEEILRTARALFPHAFIDILTNAVLLPKQPPSFFATCRECDIVITTTKYPISLDFGAIEDFVVKSGAKYRYAYNTREVQKVMYKWVIDPEGQQDPVEMFYKCSLANTCIALKDGKLSTCGLPNVIRHFNERFGANLAVSPGDFVDIYTAKNMEEILSALAKPIPFCRYCDLNSFQENIPWQPSTKNIDEWTEPKIRRENGMLEDSRH